MAEWISDYVDVNGLRLHYLRTGGEKPSLVLAHGVTDSGRSWMQIARELEDEYDVIMYDRRGHGKSDAPESGYTFSNHAEDLAHLIKALDLVRPVVIGHSGGAAAAIIFAAEYPSLLSYLILEDPPIGKGWGDWDEMLAGMTEYFKDVKSKTRDELIAYRKEESPDWVEALVSFWAEDKIRMSNKVIHSFSQSKPDWFDLFRRISCPVLLITSDQEKGPINTEDDVREMESVWRDGRAVRIPGTGHMIHNDRPKAFLSVVFTFLDQMHEREKHCGFTSRNLSSK